MSETLVQPAAEGAAVVERLEAVATQFAQQTPERQLRTALDRQDFDALAEAGFLKVGVPIEMGGLWRGLPNSIRLYADMVRTIAHGDPSVALVATMHPGVLIFWLASENAPAPYEAAWQEQRTWCFQTALEGHWWGTMTSEPGSGGDIMKTKATATPTVGSEGYVITGSKHFGSGSGITSYMITTAVSSVDQAPGLYFMDQRHMPWDGSKGLMLAREWDGIGMAATQSHAFELKNVKATRAAWDGCVAEGMAEAGQVNFCLFTSVIVGVAESAFAYAESKLAPRIDELKSFEETEWVNATNDYWTIQQLYSSMISAIEEDRNGLISAMRGKMVIAELAERFITRLGRIIGGSSFSRTAPINQWGQDVRALGFLRPPWGLAYDQLFEVSKPQ